MSHRLGHVAVQVRPLLVQSQCSVASHARHFLLQPYLSAVEVVVVVAKQLIDVFPSACVQLQYSCFSHTNSHFSLHDFAAMVQVTVMDKTSKKVMRPIFILVGPLF